MNRNNKMKSLATLTLCILMILCLSLPGTVSYLTGVVIFIPGNFYRVSENVSCELTFWNISQETPRQAALFHFPVKITQGR